jgi:hypothetical protein
MKSRSLAPSLNSKPKLTCQLYFNYKKKNSIRDRMSPYDILVSENSNIDPGILNLPPHISKDFWKLFSDRYIQGVVTLWVTQSLNTRNFLTMTEEFSRIMLRFLKRG